MVKYSSTISLLLLVVCCSSHHPVKEQQPEKINSNFSLHYLSVGLGSGMGSMQPTIHISNQRFVYTWEQNSYYVKKQKSRH